MNAGKTASLHSRYNPQREADRYIESLSIDENKRFFILIEPGMGYIVCALKKIVPRAKIISLHIEKPSGFLPSELNSLQWFPEKGLPLDAFLETEIGDSLSSAIQIVEWRPALSVYGKAYLALLEETIDFIKRSDANTRTTKAFGLRWLKNFFNNLEFLNKAILIAPPDGRAGQKAIPCSLPLLVTGSGPALEEAIPLISNKSSNKKNFFIMAVSSSFAALKARNIIPDLVLSTDGSQWAKYHLFGIFREKTEFFLASSLTAALPSQCEKIPVLVLCDGSLWQTLILNELKIPFIMLPQRGTVTASALDLGFFINTHVPNQNRGNGIYIAGMDLENRDISSHARPYAFDSLLEEKAGRMNPVYSQEFKRSSLLKAGGSFRIYSSWFKKQLPLYPGAVHPLGSNNPVFGPSENTIPNRDEKWARVSFKTITLDKNGNESPSKRALSALKAALKNEAYADALKQELTGLLVPDSSDGRCGDLLESIQKLLKQKSLGTGSGENCGK